MTWMRLSQVGVSGTVDFVKLVTGGSILMGDGGGEDGDWRLKVRQNRGERTLLLGEKLKLLSLGVGNVSVVEPAVRDEPKIKVLAIIEPLKFVHDVKTTGNQVSIRSMTVGEVNQVKFEVDLWKIKRRSMAHNNNNKRGGGLISSMKFYER